MANPPIRLTLESDLVEPDWQAMDDGDVWLAAQQKVPEAIAELARREKDPSARRSPAPVASPADLRAALRRRSRR